MAAGQLLPEGMFGTTPRLKVEPYDPEGARKLLAEAGYPNGFGLTVHSPNNRYVNDAKVAQAVAQMLTRIGIATKVEAMASATFFPQATELKFSFMLLGWGSGTGEASSTLKALLATYNKEKGFGTANRGRYSNPRVDALLEEGLATVDDSKREALLQPGSCLCRVGAGVPARRVLHRPQPFRRRRPNVVAAGEGEHERGRAQLRQRRHLARRHRLRR